MKKKTFLAALCLLLSLCVKAQAVFSGISPVKTVASEGAWCWFADPRALHYENEEGTINASWLGYIDVHGSIKATQMDWVSGRQTDVLVRAYFQPDDHDNPTFLVLPDERVLVIYSRHTDEAAFYYRVSKTPGDITTLGEEKKIVTANNTTYPSPFILSDDPTHFYLCWRGINWHPTIGRLTIPDENDDVQFDWGPYQTVQSTGARPYAKYVSNGKDKIYVTYTTGHPDNEQPNWLYCNVININASQDGTCKPTLEDLKGTKLSTIADGAFNVSKASSYQSSYPNTIVDAPSSVRDWVWQIALDDEEHPRIAMVRISSDKSQHEYYYARWTGSAWQLTDVCDGGAKFHSSNTEYCYSGGMTLDQQAPSELYVSKPVDGVYEIWHYSLSDDGTVSAGEAITENSEKNNVRPFIVSGSQGSPLRFGWMNGDYYYWMVNKSYPLGYPTSLLANYILPEAEAVRSGTLSPDYAASPSDLSGEWTLSFTCSLPSDSYYGQLLSTSALEFGVDESSVCPYLTVGGSTYSSTSQLYSSDDWASNSSGTNSDYWPTKLSSVNFTLTYSNDTLRVFRDGLLDQQLTVDLSSPSFTTDSFGSAVSDVVAINGALSPVEVETLLRLESLEELTMPEQAHTDLVLPTKAGSTPLTWTSSDPSIIASDGTFTAPDEQTYVTLTASTDWAERSFSVLALPRDPASAVRARYTFEEADVSTNAEGTTTVSDVSGNGMDLSVFGNATIDGTLNLTANTASGFSTNGYAVVPSEIVDSLRSYTFMFDATAQSLSSQPRFYDFGFSNGNSFFCRANALSAGIKYSGGTTTMTSSSTSLETGQTYNVCVTFQASNHKTCIYLDGVCVATGNENEREPYELALLSPCTRNYIGRTQWWDSTNYASENVDFKGTIDNFTVYDIALTQREINDLLGIPNEDEALNIDMSERIENRGFEASYSVLANSGVQSDRAIYLPSAWDITYTNRDEWDLSVLTSADLYASLFADVPVYEGNASYRVRQNWGKSTISLTQQLDTLPAAVYSLGAMVWTSGSGGQATIGVTVDDNAATSAAPLNGNLSEWQSVEIPFVVNGQQNTTIALNAAHTYDGSAKFLGFDDVTLFDITANATSSQLFELLSSMLPYAETLAEQLPDATNLSAAIAAAKGATADDEQSALYDDYLQLRNAILNPEDEETGITSPQAAPSSSRIYDLSGRRLARPAQGQPYITEGEKRIAR
ncbi:MAG: BNR-4 repeat-containing protein [Prevotellaceae bacterium]|nr:BNR-4 repeat-containing protein [Prevotellaceae bacterium]